MLFRRLAKSTRRSSRRCSDIAECQPSIAEPNASLRKMVGCAKCAFKPHLPLCQMRHNEKTQRHVDTSQISDTLFFRFFGNVGMLEITNPSQIPHRRAHLFGGATGPLHVVSSGSFFGFVHSVNPLEFIRWRVH